MKRILLCILFLFALGFSALAHSGDTDDKGGHHVGGTSEYHYHHGYPSHQHENGVCPYEFDDRTGYNSGSSVNRSVANVAPLAASTAASPSKTRWTAKEILLCVAICLYFLIGFAICIHAIVKQKKKGFSLIIFFPAVFVFSLAAVFLSPVAELFDAVRKRSRRPTSPVPPKSAAAPNPKNRDYDAERIESLTRSNF